MHKASHRLLIDWEVSGPSKMLCNAPSYFLTLAAMHVRILCVMLRGNSGQDELGSEGHRDVEQILGHTSPATLRGQQRGAAHVL